MIVWLPCESDEVETMALPLASVTGDPICVDASKKVTVPVMVPAVPLVTVAVKVTLAPTIDGFVPETTVVVVAAFYAAAFTV